MSRFIKKGFSYVLESLTMKRRKLSNKERSHGVFVSFDDLSDDLKIEILCKFPAKLLAKLTCVCKSWQFLIINFCFPKMASKLAYTGYVSCVRRCINFKDVLIDEKLIAWWKTIERTLNERDLLDSCNGLVLGFYATARYPQSQSSSRRLCRYYVLNILTQQFDTITKQPHPRTSRYKYAALAYDPSKSCHYKIVYFQGFSALNIYNSKTGVWISLKYQHQLEHHVRKANWEKRSVYFDGALYRLSMSGHLIKFIVDQEITASARVKVESIDLPEFAKKSPLACIGVNQGAMHFSYSDKSNLRIWMLRHNCIRTDNNYVWCLKYTIPSQAILSQMIPSTYFKPMAFHPHDDTIILSLRNDNWFCKIEEYYFGDLQENKLRLSDPHTHYGSDCKVVFPYLQCEVPFPIGTVSIHSSFIYSSTLYLDCLLFYIYLDLFTNYIYVYI